MTDGYVDFIERELGIAEPGKTNIELAVFDMGRKIGVGVRIEGRDRHAVRVPFEPGWEVWAVKALREWKNYPLWKPVADDSEA